MSSNSDVATRWATVDDARAIAEIHVATWRWAYAGIMPDQLLHDLSVEKRYERRKASLQQDATTTLVVTLREQIVGFANVLPARDDDCDESVGEVAAIYLHPDAIGIGAGRVLWNRAAAELAKLRFTEYVVWVLHRNHRARAFYERMGMHDDRTSKTIELGGQDLLELRYRGPLDHVS